MSKEKIVYVEKEPVVEKNIFGMAKKGLESIFRIGIFMIIGRVLVNGESYQDYTYLIFFILAFPKFILPSDANFVEKGLVWIIYLIPIAILLLVKYNLKQYLVF